MAAIPTGAIGTRVLAVDAERLAQWVSALDEVIEELQADLVRRSIVHLSTLREDLRSAGASATPATFDQP